MVWKYRDFIGEYMKGNAGPAREKMDGIFLERFLTEVEGCWTEQRYRSPRGSKVE